jgi:hypothetical protein
LLENYWKINYFFINLGGHALFQMQFVYNRKRNTVEMQINQDAANQGSRGVRKYVGPVTVAVQELDGWFSYTMVNTSPKKIRQIDVVLFSREHEVLARL